MRFLCSVAASVALVSLPALAQEGPETVPVGDLTVSYSVLGPEDGKPSSSCTAGG